jgi:nucleotide-binding universal stress UspA family protein
MWHFNRCLIKMFNGVRILVGYDASPQSKKALDAAIAIAKKFSGVIKVVNVYEKGMEETTQARLIEVKETLKREQINYTVEPVLGPDPAKILEKTAKSENFNLIVIGSRGLGNAVSFLLGSVSKQIVSNAYCNVLVVKQ